MQKIVFPLDSLLFNSITVLFLFNVIVYGWHVWLTCDMIFDNNINLLPLSIFYNFINTTNIPSIHRVIDNFE